MFLSVLYEKGSANFIFCFKNLLYVTKLSMKIKTTLSKRKGKDCGPNTRQIFIKFAINRTQIALSKRYDHCFRNFRSLGYVHTVLDSETERRRKCTG